MVGTIHGEGADPSCVESGVSGWTPNSFGGWPPGITVDCRSWPKVPSKFHQQAP